jgi:hypothetical protein
VVEEGVVARGWKADEVTAMGGLWTEVGQVGTGGEATGGMRENGGAGRVGCRSGGWNGMKADGDEGRWGMEAEG